METRAADADTLTVASVPATHVYVRRLAHPRVRRLQDPSGDDLRTPNFLDPAWWRRIDPAPDLLHIHFGFEYYAPAQLEELAEVLERRSVPLVYTVHDLRNPNHPTPELHDAGLDVLLARADRLVTLTEAAATAVEERSGRRPDVLPHPHVAELDTLPTRGPRRAPDGRFRLVLHFKSLRANMVRSELLAAAADVARDRDDLALQVRMHCDVVSPEGGNHDPELVALACDLADEGLVELRVHPYLSHAALIDLIAESDGFVLPYRFGTHSGLLELCRDLGTAVIAPACGGYGDQGAHQLFRVDEEHGFDPDSFRDAVAAAVAAGPPAPQSADARRRQREDVARSHFELYRDVLRGGAGCRGARDC